MVAENIPVEQNRTVETSSSKDMKNRLNDSSEENVKSDNSSNVSEDNNDTTTSSSPVEEKSKKGKKIVMKGVTGTVRWFNVRLGYGFIKRNDNDEDIYVFFKEIAKKNPAKRLKSLATDEDVQFDVVEGKKGFEAGNVTGLNGEPVKGSHIDYRYRKPMNGGKKKFFNFKKYVAPNKERDPSKKVLENKVKGKVLFFNNFKGYGFLKRNDNEQNVYCHLNDIVKKNPKKFKFIPKDTEVLFDIVEGLKGVEASYVTDLEGKPFLGYKKYSKKVDKESSKNNIKTSEKMKKRSRKTKKNDKKKDEKKSDDEKTSDESNKTSENSSPKVRDNKGASNNNVTMEKMQSSHEDQSLAANPLS
uniref:CSD domain-containing protein n=1 Tax=Parastrongyloides trichosuri TaxID=131310 RepID=A0A0N4Z4G9_PARTI